MQICLNCEKTFASEASLNLHIKTTKCSKNKDKKKFKCEYCDKLLSTNQMLHYHHESCEQKKIFEAKSYYENIIQNLKIEHGVKEKEYQAKISDLERRVEYLLPATKYINLADYNMSNPASSNFTNSNFTNSNSTNSIYSRKASLESLKNDNTTNL